MHTEYQDGDDVSKQGQSGIEEHTENDGQNAYRNNVNIKGK
jgi:hypothetical protein